MDNNKTPAPDDLPKEFYSKFFYLFAQGFVEMLNQSLKLASSRHHLGTV